MLQLFTARFRQVECLLETSAFVTILVAIGSNANEPRRGSRSGYGHWEIADRRKHRNNYLRFADKAGVFADHAMTSWTASPSARSNACTMDGRSIAPARAS